jgi:hypothetical protein
MYSYPDELNKLNPNRFLGIQQQPWNKQVSKLSAPKEEKRKYEKHTNLIRALDMETRILPAECLT